MTADATPPPDPEFADLVDELFAALLDGETPDLEALARQRPAIAPRLHEAYALACAVAGRRTPGPPMLGGYRIVRELGRGGMGTVYLAQHEDLQRDVALKVLPHSLGLSPHAKRRFLAEARALARLQHPHVVRIHRIIDDGELLAFEMEHIDGPTLQQVLESLRAQGPKATTADLAAALGLPVERLGVGSPLQFFVRLAIDIGRALAEAHRLGIVHRDVKPANILLQSTGRALLADFGLARGGDQTITKTGAFAGTPVYAAPEQLRGDSTIDGRADVYGLAVTLYEAIAQTPPFAGKSSSELLHRIETGAVPPLRRRAPHAPRDLETILQKAMEIDPQHRYAGADEFASDLQRLLDLQPILARRAGPVRRLAKVLRRHRTHLIAGAAGAAAVALAMWPLFGNVGAAERDARAASDHLRSARQHLLQLPRLGSLDQFGSGPARRHARYVPPGAEERADHLEAAIAEYEQARALLPADQALQTELRIAQLAHWLRTRSPERSERIEQTLAGAEFQALLSGLPPSVAEQARAYVLDAAGDDDSGPRALPQRDLFALGMLAFLVNDLRRCEACWSGLETTAGELPLVDAVLGILHHADGRPDVACVRLFQACRSLPDTRFLQLELAEAAAAVGEPRPARELLASAMTPADDLEAVRLELLALDTEDLGREAVRQRCEQLALRYPTEPLPRRRLALLAMADGDWARARTLLRQLVDEWPDAASYRLDLARTALQLADLPTYAQQLYYVVQSRYGAGRSNGAVQALLEILWAGDCRELLERGRAAAASGPLPTRPVGLQRPVASFAPRGAQPLLERLLPCWVALGRTITADFDATHLRLRLWRAAAWLPLPWPGWLLPDGTRTRVTTATALGQLQLPSPNLVFAHVLASAGDFDRDGVDDLLLGNPPDDPTVSRGLVAVVSGASGAPLLSFANADAAVLYGHSCAAAGDVDGDGIGDFVVGAPSGVRESAHGLAEVVAGATGKPIHSWRQEQAGYGVSVAGIGDVDGDGAPDVAVGLSPELRNRKAQGSVEVHSGRTGALLRTFVGDRAGVWFGSAIADAGDVDADGTDDLIVGGNHIGVYRAAGLVRVYSGRSGARLHTWIDETPQREFGRSVAGAGDVDGDGHADLVVAAPGVSAVHVYSGSDGRELAYLAHGSAGERFGHAIAAGDLDGDGRPELVIGSGYASTVAAFALLPTRLLHSWHGHLAGDYFGHSLACVRDAARPRGRAVTFAIHPSGGNGLWSLAVPDAR